MPKIIAMAGKGGTGKTTVTALLLKYMLGRGLTPILAVDAGVNRMALPSEGAIERAIDHGLEIRYQRTCCSVGADFSREIW